MSHNCDCIYAVSTPCKRKSNYVRCKQCHNGRVCVTVDDIWEKKKCSVINISLRVLSKVNRKKKKKEDESIISLCPISNNTTKEKYRKKEKKKKVEQIIGPHLLPFCVNRCIQRRTTNAIKTIKLKNCEKYFMNRIFYAQQKWVSQQCTAQQNASRHRDSVCLSVHKRRLMFSLLSFFFPGVWKLKCHLANASNTLFIFHFFHFFFFLSIFES